MVRALVVGLLFALVSLAPARAAGPVIFYQAACPLTNGACTSIDSSLTVATIRSYAFRAPSAGKALVTFNGSMQCVNTTYSAGGSFGVAQFVGQITTTPTDVPTLGGNSSFQVATRIVSAEPSSGATYSVPYSMTAVLQTSYAGTAHQDVYLRLKNIRVDAAVSCIIFTGQFSVVFVPS